MQMQESVVIQVALVVFNWQVFLYKTVNKIKTEKFNTICSFFKRRQGKRNPLNIKMIRLYPVILVTISC